MSKPPCQSAGGVRVARSGSRPAWTGDGRQEMKLFYSLPFYVAIELPKIMVTGFQKRGIPNVSVSTQCVCPNLLPNLKIGVFVFSLLSSEISYEFWIHVPYQISVTNIFPRCVACFLIF